MEADIRITMKGMPCYFLNTEVLVPNNCQLFNQSIHFFCLLPLSTNSAHSSHQGFPFTSKNPLVTFLCMGVVEPDKSFFICNGKYMLHIWSWKTKQYLYI